MNSSRLFHASAMLFWISYLALLALVATYAPQGGVELAGLTLFGETGLVDAAIAAMAAIGLSMITQAVVFGLLAGFNVAAAGLVVFSMMFRVFGEEREQLEARPLMEGATACAAAAALLTVVISLAGGQPGALMVLQLAAFGGLLLMVLALGEPEDLTAESGSGDAVVLDDIIADHAANHAAFSAQLASLSRREQSS